MDSPLSGAFLEYFLISAQFASRLSHMGLKIWLTEFPSMQTFLPFLKNHYIDALPACLALAHSAFKNPRQPAGLALINNLANALHHINRPDIVQHFVRLLFTGNPTIISQVSRLLYPDINMSFSWLCIRLCIPIRHIIPSEFIHALMSIYVKAVEKSIKNELDMNTLKKIFHPYLDTFCDLNDANMSDQEAHFMVHLISVGVLRASQAHHIQHAMLRFLVCPLLTSVQLNGPRQIALAFEFTSAFIRLLNDLSAPEIVQLAFDTLPAVNRILFTPDSPLPSLSLVSSAFVDYLTSPVSSISNLFFYPMVTSSKMHLVKALLKTFLQFVAWCVQFGKSEIRSDLKFVAWTALLDVLSYSPSDGTASPIIQHYQNIRPLLQKVRQTAEMQLGASTELPVDLHVILIAVLLELDLEMKQPPSLNTVPLNCANLTFLGHLISFCSVKSCERSDEIFESLEVSEVKTLSIPMSYYLAAEKRVKYWESRKRFTLLFFAFHRFIRSFDFLNSDHCNVLRRFVHEIVHFKRHDLTRLAEVRHNQIRIWLSDSFSTVLKLLESKDLKRCPLGDLMTNSLFDFLEFFCVGDGFPVIQVTPAQLKSLLQLVVEIKSRSMQLQMLRMLAKWSRMMDPLEPDQYLAWPRHNSLTLPARSVWNLFDPTGYTLPRKIFAFARSSISLSYWQQDSNQPSPPSVLSTIWPARANRQVFQGDEGSVGFEGSTATFNRDSNGLTVSLWYKLETAIQDEEFTKSPPQSESTLITLASSGELLHLFTLEESSRPVSSVHSIRKPSTSRTSPSTSRWSIEVWLIPSTRSVYTRICRPYSIDGHSNVPQMVSREAILSNVLTTSTWSHLLFSIMWNKPTDLRNVGRISVISNVSKYAEKIVTMPSPDRIRYRSLDNRQLPKFPEESRSLHLWVGHAGVVSDMAVNEPSLKTPNLFTSGLLVFTGAVFSKVAVSEEEEEGGGGMQSLMKKLALYLAFCGPSWNGIPPNGWVDTWTILSARARCYLNALLGRLDSQDLVDVFTRGQRILGSVGQTHGDMVLWIRTLRKLIKHHLLVSVGYPSADSVNWMVLTSPSHQRTATFSIPSGHQSASSGSRESAVHSGSFQVASKLRQVDPVSNLDIEVDDEDIVSGITKYSIDSAITSLGSVDSALFLAGVTACLDEPDSEIIEASMDFILTLRERSAAAAEHFLRPLSEELVSPSSDEAFDRLHITSYGLCLLSSLFNQLRLKQVILAFQNVIWKHAFLKVNDEDAYLLIDPELIACSFMFSSMQTLSQAFISLENCMKEELCRGKVYMQISTCNTTTVDAYQLVEAAVIGFRICFSTSSNESALGEDFNVALAAIARLISRRLLIATPPPTSLSTFLLRILVTSDPDLYHNAATRIFDSISGSSDPSTTSTHLSLTNLAQEHLQYLHSIFSFSKTAGTAMSNNADLSRFEEEGEEVKEEKGQSLPPAQSPLPSMSTKPTPWISLQPPLTLEDASMVETETLAKFREKLVSDDDDYIDSSHTSALFSSYYNLAELKNLDLFDETNFEDGQENSNLIARPQSLPNISVLFAKDVSFSDDGERSNRSISSETNGSPLEGAFFSTPSSVEPQIASPLRLVQRHQLAAVILSALVEFWEKQLERTDIKRESVSPPLVPPLWVIYHLGGHPCVQFRAYALSLYGKLLKNRKFLERENSISTGRMLATQFISPTSSITSMYSSELLNCARGSTLDSTKSADLAFAHVALTSPALISAAPNFLNDQVSNPDNLAASTSIIMAIFAAALVDISTFQQLFKERPCEEKFAEALNSRWANFHESLTKFFNYAKGNTAVLVSLYKPFTLRIYLEVVLFLQTSCCEVAIDNFWAQRFHEIGYLVSRLVSATISRAKDRVSFTSIQAFVCSLLSIGDKAALNRPCVVRKVLLRVLFTLLDRIMQDLIAERIKRDSLLIQLQWTIEVIEKVLLYQGSSLSFNPLATETSSFRCSQFPIVQNLEKTLITFLVNSTSLAMHSAQKTAGLILSKSLLLMTWTWCDALFETLKISESGLRLLELLSNEPQIIDKETASSNIEVTLGLKENLEMLVAVFSDEPEDDHRRENFGSEFEDYHRKLSDSMKILLEWFTNLSFSLDSFERTTPLYHSIDDFSISSPALLNFNLGTNNFDWLTPLRETNDAGQFQWSGLVSQHRHILDVVAPFYWMQLGGALSHESSIFPSTAPKPSFSHIDTFENDSRQRCRRRPVVVWVDDRFVRTISIKSLGQYQRMHQLSPLMMQHQTYTVHRGLAKSRCNQIPHVLFPPSSQGLFPPPSVPLADKCLGVWPCQLVELADAVPLNGDLTLSANWIHLQVNNEELAGYRESRTSSAALIHGLEEESGPKGLVTCPLRSVARVEERRYELRDLALEIFFDQLSNVPPIMIAFRSKKDRDHFIQTLVGACGALRPRSCSPWWQLNNGEIESGRRRLNTHGRYLPWRLRDACDTIVGSFSTPFVGRTTRERLLDAQVAWLRGQISNFDYIIALNSAAGRTYNDITQYPIFPWVIADYESQVLNLKRIQGTYRRLDRPISVQSDVVAATVMQKYEDLKAQQMEQAMIGSGSEDQQHALLYPVYHYSSFCSNEAIVLHHLFRLIPFAFRLIQFQDGNFDDPNRLFSSVALEWSLATDSAKHVKELVPEFFFRADFFTNYENFELGVRHDGRVVDSVELPPWAKGDPHLFVLVNRAVLESPYVTAHLPEWIDLVFGYKQTGRAGERALNLYHPFTYFGAIDVDRIENSVRRNAVQTMIRNYGQVPRQLFPTHPHPRRVCVKTSAIGPSMLFAQSIAPQLSDFSRFVRRIILGSHRSQRELENMPMMDLSHPRVEPKIAIVEPSPMEEDNQIPSPEVGVAASFVPLTAGAPLDTVRGLRWGDWAGNPRSSLGVSWYTKLQGGPRCYRLHSLSYSFWTVLVSDSLNSLFLLQQLRQPLLLVKIGYQPGIITAVARRFFDGVEMYTMNIPMPRSEPVSAFLTAPYIRGKPLSEVDLVYLLVGTPTGGLFARCLTAKELCNGLTANANDEEELYQNLSTPARRYVCSSNYVRTPESAQIKKVCLSSPTVAVGWQCLIGHTGAPIGCLDTCPQNGLIASGDALGRVIIWDMVSMAYITSLDMDNSCAVFGAVCGLAFDQKSGDLLVARTGPNGPFEIWIGLFTADCRQCSSRILDFQAEIGVTTQMNSSPSCDTRENFPIIFSPSRGYHVGCILIGGPTGCLAWLSSWTLDTVSIMQLDQPSPCPIVALSFAPPSSRPTVHIVDDDETVNDSTLYVIDSEGWMYFLDSGVSSPARQFPVKSPSRGFRHQDSDVLYLSGLWI
ncbi:hypothetical protein Aperf_G00000007061 [Anoplocephala perfoliata]